MPQFVVTSPDGRKFRVNAPEGATQDDAIAYVQRQQQAAPAPRPAITGPYVPFVDDTGARAPSPQVGFDLGGTNIGLMQPEAKQAQLQAASIGTAAGLPDTAPEYARSTGQAMKEAVAALPLLAVGGSAFNAPTLAGRMGRGAVAGGLGGGLFGVATGEGSAEDRLMRGLGFGGTGAALGAATPLAAEAVTRGGRAGAGLVSRLWRGQEGRTNVAARMWAEKIREQFPKLTPEQALARAERMVAQYGDDAAILDVGRRTQQFAADTARPGGAAGTTIDDFLLHRQVGRMTPSGRMAGGQTGRISGIIDDAAGGRTSGLAAQRSLKAAQKAASDPLYKVTANNPANLVPGEKVAPLLDDPYISEQIAKVKADKLSTIKVGGERVRLADLPDNSLPVIDAAQKRMSDQAGEAFRKGATFRGGNIADARQRLVQTADEAFPDYAKAREVWRDFKGVMDADDLGRKFMRGDVDVLDDAVKRMTPEELRQFRAGAAAALKAAAEKTKAGGDAFNKLFGSRDLQSRARIAFGRQYRNNIARMVGEGKKFQSFAEAFRGSQTTERAARLAKTGIDAKELARELAGTAADVVTGNKVGLAMRGVRGAVRAPGLLGPPAAVREEIARIGTGRDFGAIRQGMGAAKMTEAQRKALEKLLLTGEIAEGRNY